MTTPARRHYLRVTAAQASASAADDNQPLENASAYELMLLKLAEDRRRLKDVQSMEAKAELKRKLLPDYAPWVEGAIAAGKGAQDDVLMTVMLWRIDAGDYNGALDIAEYALPYQLVMPDRYQRTTATTLVEEVADAAKRARDGKQPFDISILQRCQALTEAEDMHDQVRAKLHKELGLLQEPSDPAAALANLTRAKALHDKVGVVKDIERIEKAIKNNTATGG
ncbi:terminase endonuclease subunit [Chromobacterium alkanivorans]|uniref:phage terminase small subunit n=1 Tax=Chromobacterium alkanivorans TaxID=1071719 RepID=UPI0019679DE7|nr:terminase endonuclease subunit [Chromobacterium alkanivorans]MBN3005570.1 terminase endonuclease subunit [Chromobacterium alkanivorans]